MENDKIIIEEDRNCEDLDQDSCHVLTASLMSDIAAICNISYSQVLNHVNNCRSHSDLEEHVQLFIIRYRPDLYS